MGNAYMIRPNVDTGKPFHLIFLQSKLLLTRILTFQYYQHGEIYQSTSPVEDHIIWTISCQFSHWKGSIDQTTSTPTFNWPTNIPYHQPSFPTPSIDHSLAWSLKKDDTPHKQPHLSTPTLTLDTCCWIAIWCIDRKSTKYIIIWTQAPRQACRMSSLLLITTIYRATYLPRTRDS